MKGISVPVRVLAFAAIAGVALVGCGRDRQSGGSVAQGNGQGMMGDVSGYDFSSLTCAAPAHLPGRTVNVVLGDMGLTQMMGGVAPMGSRMALRASPTSVAAGSVSFVVSNMGWRTHEMVILPLAAGTAAGQRAPGADGKVSENGSLGEASASCGAGAGDGIHSAAVAWTTVTLRPGRYELLCNLRNHYADGMWQELDVTS